MRTIKELNGIKSVQSLLIFVIHAGNMHFLMRPIEDTAVRSFDEPPSVWTSVATHLVAMWPKGAVEPFFLISGILMTLEVFRLLDESVPASAGARNSHGEERLIWRSAAAEFDIVRPLLKSIARRAVRYWIVALPLALFSLMVLSDRKGLLAGLFFYINCGDYMNDLVLVLWTNAATMQAAIALPVYILACETNFVRSNPRLSPSEVAMRRIGYLCSGWLIAVVVRLAVVWFCVPATNWSHDYTHAFMFTSSEHVEYLRKIAGVPKLVWEDSPLISVALAQLPKFQYFRPYMRGSTFLSGAVVGAAIHHNIRFGSDQIANVVTTLVVVGSALLDHFAWTHADLRVHFMFSLLASQVPIAVIIYMTVTRQGALGRAFSSFYSSDALQRFTPFTLCLYAYHHAFLYTVVQVYMSTLTETSYMTVCIATFLGFVPSVLTAYVAHKFFEVPLYSHVIKLCGLHSTSKRMRVKGRS